MGELCVILLKESSQYLWSPWQHDALGKQRHAFKKTGTKRWDAGKGIGVSHCLPWLPRFAAMVTRHPPARTGSMTLLPWSFSPKICKKCVKLSLSGLSASRAFRVLGSGSRPRKVARWSPSLNAMLFPLAAKTCTASKFGLFGYVFFGAGVQAFKPGTGQCSHQQDTVICCLQVLATSRTVYAACFIIFWQR